MLCTAPGYAQISPAIQSARGPFAVGFRIVKQYDKSRQFNPSNVAAATAQYQGERPRPVQTLVWYPASVSSPVKALRYQDYVRTRFSEINFTESQDHLSNAMAGYEASLRRRLGSDALDLLNSKVATIADATPLLNRFPLVLYAPGAGGSADENAELCEYLSSYGYVVMSSTSMAAAGKEIGDDMASVEPQVADLLFLLNYASSLPFVDTRKVAVMGWSWGGMTNVFATTRDHRIGAIISLDGTREPELTRNIDINNLTAPWLYVSRSPDTISQINRSGIDTSFSLLNAAKFADVYQLIAYPMQHFDFTSMRLHESSPGSYREYQREELVQAYTVIAEYIRHFLASALHKDQAAQAFLERKPKDNGAAPHSMRMDINKAQPKQE